MSDNEAAADTAADDTTATTDSAPPADTGDGNEVEKWKTLARKHEAQAKANAEAAKRLKEIEDSEKSEVTRAGERIAELEKALADERMTNLRNKVAAAKGLPPALAARLTGDDEDAMSADADALLEGLGTLKPPKPTPADTGAGVPPVSTTDENDPKALAEAVLNKH